jgi:hypothetical protein
MCISEYQAHQVAFLTQRGWTCHDFASGCVWTKPGETRTVEKSHPCGCCKYEEQTEEFDLDDAYWREA